MLLDTTIFIDYLKGREQAAGAVVRARAESTVTMHLVVAAELIAGVLNRSELRRTLALISSCRLLLPDESDMRRALRLLERHGLADGLDWNDCLIGATALRLRHAVVTLNEKHFRAIRGVRVVRPY
jgi:predicted nucleic acid-binding protein